MFSPSLPARLSCLVLLGLVILCPAPVVAGPEDALARPEFDKELSVDMKGADVVSAFRMISRSTLVPFVIDFDPDPSLRLTFKAQNMVGRGILASLAGAYGLTFASSDEGIVVRRVGALPATTRVTVGAWPFPTGTEQYELDFVVRDPAGNVVSRPRITVLPGARNSGRLGVGLAGGREVLTFDHERNIVEPRRVGDVGLAFSVQRELNGGLDIILELVVSTPVSADSYSEVHTVAQRHALPNESVLIRSAEGYEFELSRWTRLGTRPSKR